jgi:hypothetical protein
MNFLTKFLIGAAGILHIYATIYYWLKTIKIHDGK